MTGIQNFGAYLTAMLEIDAFFLNEDRHTNNIAVLYDTETEQYSPSPLFDQGLCLFADISNDYPLDLPMDVCMERIEAKPFSSDFDTQLDAAEELYGIQLHFPLLQKMSARNWLLWPITTLWKSASVLSKSYADRCANMDI